MGARVRRSVRTQGRNGEPRPAKWSYGERLRALRLRSGVTQREVADAFGLTEGAYRNYESGRNEPPSSALPIMARVMGLDVCDFCCELFEGALAERPRPPARAGRRTPADIFEDVLARGFVELEPGQQEAVRDLAAESEADRDLLTGVFALARRYREQVRQERR